MRRGSAGHAGGELQVPELSQQLGQALVGSRDRCCEEAETTHL